MSQNNHSPAHICLDRAFTDIDILSVIFPGWWYGLKLYNTFHLVRRWWSWWRVVVAKMVVLIWVVLETQEVEQTWETQISEDGSFKKCYPWLLFALFLLPVMKKTAGPEDAVPPPWCFFKFREAENHWLTGPFEIMSPIESCLNSVILVTVLSQWYKSDWFSC